MAGAFAYTLARAALLPVFHDEAYTYFTYGQASFPVILSELGNNHILNTFFMKWSSWLFGMNELSLRLPALGGHLLFLTGVYRVLNLFLKKKFFAAGAVFLTFNLFVLELFSAGRGYALALGFFMQAMPCFLKRMGAGRPEGGRSLFTLLALAVFAHLSFLYVYISVFVVCGVELLYRNGWFSARRKRAPGIMLWREARFPLMLTGLLFLALVRPVWVQVKRGGFYHGGENGFGSDTVRSLGTASLYNRVSVPENFWIWVYPALAGCVTGIGAFLIFRRMRPDGLSAGERMLSGIFSLLMGAVGLIVGFHHVFGIKYVMGRMAVFLIPLFGLTLTLFWACLFDLAGRGLRPWLKGAAGAAAAAALALFVGGVNFKNYTIAPEDHLSRDVIAAFQSARGTGVWGTKDISLGTHSLFVPSLYFYARKNHLAWLEIADITNANAGACDAYYIFERSAPGVSRYTVGPDFNKVDLTSLRVLVRYPDPGTVLALSPEPEGF